jgi:hypothetical protein
MIKKLFVGAGSIADAAAAGSSRRWTTSPPRRSLLG